MFGLDPRIMVVVAVIFVGLGGFNFYAGRGRLQAARQEGSPVAWYKNVSILTGIEYILLAVVLLLRMAATYHTISGGAANLVVPLYTFLLLVAAVVLGLMLYQGIRGVRSSRRVLTQPAASVATEEGDAERVMTPEQRIAYAQKRRERRQKAAAARRRRGGRA